MTNVRIEIGSATHFQSVTFLLNLKFRTLAITSQFFLGRLIAQKARWLQYNDHNFIFLFSLLQITPAFNIRFGHVAKCLFWIRWQKCFEDVKKSIHLQRKMILPYTWKCGISNSFCVCVCVMDVAFSRHFWKFITAPMLFCDYKNIEIVIIQLWHGDT